MYITVIFEVFYIHIFADLVKHGVLALVGEMRC